MIMKREDWEYLGFGFGTAVVLGLAAWGAVELTKKLVAKHREKSCACGCEDDESCEDDCEECCEECCEEEYCEECCDEDCCDEDCCGEADGTGSGKNDSDDIIEKSVNAQDEIVSPEFGRKTEA